MSEMWNKVVKEGKEQDVVGAMQILDKSLKSIVFLSGEMPYRSESRGGIMLGFEGVQGRLPLGSYGEGMRRLLALALALDRQKLEALRNHLAENRKTSVLFDPVRFARNLEAAYRQILTDRLSG